MINFLIAITSSVLLINALLVLVLIVETNNLRIRVKRLEARLPE